MKTIDPSKIRFSFLVVISLLFSFPLLSQAQSSYTLSGKVVDKNNGEVLPGATIIIENTEIGTTSELDGTFKLSGIKQSKITIIVSYVGFESFRLDHDFNESKKTNFTIRLIPSATQLDQVQVEAESEGQVRAFIKQKESSNLKNIVSSEQIQQFPDMNAAEAMQRIPGITLQRDQGEGRFVQLRGTPPELTNFNVNGEQVPSPEGGVRYVGMDVISADQIDMIEVTKMLTPDMDADAIAGTVNIITKRASTNDPEINATIAGGYSHLRQTPNYNLQFSYGQRYGKFGVYMNGSYYVNNYGSDNMEFKYVKSAIWGNQGQDDNYVVRYRQFQLRHYDITRKRTGVSATLDYEFNKESFIYLRGMFNAFTDDEVRRRKLYDLDDPLTENYYLYGGIDHDIKDRIKYQNLNTINIGGQHKTGLLKIDYEAAYAYAGQNTPNRIFARFDNPGQALAIKFDYSDDEWPKPYFPKPEDQEVAFDYAGYEFDRLSLRRETVSDQNITGKANIQFDYINNPDHSGFIKIGGKVRLKQKEQDINAMVLGSYNTTNPLYPGEAPELTLPGVDDGFRDDNLLNQGYVIESIPYSENMDNHYEFYPWFFIMSRDNLREETIMQDYYAEEDIYAGYFMLQHQLRDLMLLGGVRYERTEIYYEGRKAIYHPSTNKFIDADTIPENRRETFFIPYLQLKYDLNDNTNIRAGFTYTFARPNFDDIIPSYEGNEDGDYNLGNPDLAFPRSLNFDIAAEKYIQGNGIISTALFYKEIENFISKYSTFAKFDSLNNRNGFINTSINGIKSYVYGAELQSQFKLRFLPGLLKDLGLYLNYTYTYSDAEIPQRKPANYTDFVFDQDKPFLEQFSEEGIENITLPGQAKHAANVAVFFETKKLYAKLSANYHDNFLYELGADRDLDVYYREALHLDFTSYYQINDHLNIFIDLVNLTNQPLVFYLRDVELIEKSAPPNFPDETVYFEKEIEQRISKKEFYSWTARLGIKLSF